MRKSKIFVCAILLSAISTGNGGSLRGCFAADEHAQRLTPQVRRPAALVPHGDWLLVGNQRSGTVSVVDMAQRRVVAEHRVSEQIADMTPHPGDSAAFVIDGVKHRLLAIKVGVDDVAVEAIAEVAPFPTRMIVSEKHRCVFVSSRWSRRVSIIDFDDRFKKPVRVRQVPLEFPPHELLLIEGQRKLIAADAFGGRLAVIDVAMADVERVRDLPAHNIRGLALSFDGSTLLLSCQMLASRSWADRDSVHWGILLSNAVRGLNVKLLLDPQQDVVKESWLEKLGLVGRAAGDPGPILIDKKGRQAVALCGVGEVRINASSYAQTLPVGRRPSAMVSLDNRLFVANQFDDSISIIDLPSGTVYEPISLGPPTKLSARDRGELLFYDARLSHDRWMSCHSCHSDGHTINLLADTLGDGDFGAPKRIPSLLGTKATGPWAWNGKVKSLDAQVRKSVRTTMHGSRLSNAQAGDLVAFLESLRPPPSRFAADAALVSRGRRVFERRSCIDCHAPPEYTAADTFDVGLRDEAGLQHFNPPSLRGLGQRDIFFHDGRGSRVEDVIQKNRHQVGEPISDDEAAALLAFLRSL